MAAVNDLLKFNTWSRNKAEDLKPISYDLHCIEKDIMDRLRESIPEPLNPKIPISFEVQLATERSLVAIDTSILQDVLQPLIINALQATTCGSITVKVSTQAGNSKLEFDIVDTGSGIPLCDRTRIFQAFAKGVYSCDWSRAWSYISSEGSTSTRWNGPSYILGPWDRVSFPGRAP